MRYLTLGEVVELHRLVLTATGGAPGIRDLGALESAVAQTRASFGGRDLHGSLIEKAGALGFALAQGHPFVDGNKRVAHASMATFFCSTAVRSMPPSMSRSVSCSTWPPVVSAEPN